MTLLIMISGGVILLVFIVVPLQEFRYILARLRRKPTSADPVEAQRGLDSAAPTEDRRA